MRNDAEKKENVQREKFSQVATSPGAQRRKKRPIEQNPAPVTRILQKSTSLIHSPLHRSLISIFSSKIAKTFLRLN